MSEITGSIKALIGADVSDYKKAIVTLKAGESIEFFEGV